MKLGIAITLVLSVAGVTVVQHRAATATAKEKDLDDVYLLPPPSQLDAMSLGYRSALSDVMWSDVLVAQGFRLQEHRHYDTLVPLLEGITHLDPQFRAPYLYADALITFQSVPSTRDDAVAARRILELGVKNRPLDAELWLNLGTFVCFLAPSSILTDPAEQAEWREEGALDLQRAVELSGNDASIAWQALGGGSRFMRMGERDAAIRFYRKVLEATDDDELRAAAEQKLNAVLTEEQELGPTDTSALHQYRAREEAKARVALEALRPELRTARRHYYPGLPFDIMLILGPSRSPDQCAARRSPGSDCMATWSSWAEQRGRDLGLNLLPSDAGPSKPSK